MKNSLWYENQARRMDDLRSSLEDALKRHLVIQGLRYKVAVLTDSLAEEAGNMRTLAAKARGEERHGQK